MTIMSSALTGYLIDINNNKMRKKKKTRTHSHDDANTYFIESNIARFVWYQNANFCNSSRY